MAVQFDDQLVSLISDVTRKLGYPHQHMISGAGHDACHVSRVVPTAMIFVPCDKGLSHTEIENAKKEDLEAGCNVLCAAAVEMAMTEHV